jgi:hypothetical protein
MWRINKMDIIFYILSDRDSVVGILLSLLLLMFIFVFFVDGPKRNVRIVTFGDLAKFLEEKKKSKKSEKKLIFLSKRTVQIL